MRKSEATVLRKGNHFLLKAEESLGFFYELIDLNAKNHLGQG